MPEGEEEKIKVQFLNGREEEFLNAKKLKDYMCHNGYSHIIVNEKTAGLNDDIDKVISHKDPNDTICLIRTEEAIGEGIIYLNPHLNDEQKGRIREQFKDKELEDITALYLNNLDLEVLPNSFRYLTNLQVLEVRNNQLASLDPIKDMMRISTVDASGNQLEQLPELNTERFNWMNLKENPLPEGQALLYTGNEVRLLPGRHKIPATSPFEAASPVGDKGRQIK